MCIERPRGAQDGGMSLKKEEQSRTAGLDGNKYMFLKSMMQMKGLLTIGSMSRSQGPSRRCPTLLFPVNKDRGSLKKSAL